MDATGFVRSHAHHWSMCGYIAEHAPIRVTHGALAAPPQYDFKVKIKVDDSEPDAPAQPHPLPLPAPA